MSVDTAGAGAGPAEVGIVIATRDRREALLESLGQIASLPERPPTVVVDNASTDGTPAAVAAAFPSVEVLALERNCGAFARNLGVERLDTPVVAFCDDDSWWRPGSLARAAEKFRRFPALGLLAARILVGRENVLDPTSALMCGAVPPGLPGPRVSGFLACGALVHRSAFLEAGGFCRRFLIGSEETLLAIDMRAAGWDLCYADDVIAVHMPHHGDRGDRSWLRIRNALWTSWLRMPRRQALRDTADLAAEALGDRVARRALIAALLGAPWTLRKRRPLPRWLARELAETRAPSTGAPGLSS